MLERIIVSLSFLSSSIVFALHFLRAVQGNAYRVPFGISKKDDAVILGGGAIQAAFGILLSFLSLDSGGKIAVACGTVVPLYIAGLVLYLCKRTKFKFTKRGARIFTAVLILLTGGTAASIVTG
ncbi:MAG: hypothetical protein LBN25_03755, partial [Christensenellaceae bacterium]|nr:hypothetical protein [Christensenellaceae bacterium]